MGEFADDAIGFAFQIGMNIDSGNDDSIKQRDGEEQGDIPSRSQEEIGGMLNCIG